MLFVINTLRIGGAETFVINLTNYLSRNTEHDIFLLATNYENFSEQNDLEKKLELKNGRYLSIKQPGFLKKGIRNRLIKKLYWTFLTGWYKKFEISKTKKILTDMSPDIVITNQLYSDRIIHQCGLKVPYIIVDQGDYRLPFNDKLMLLENCDHIICVSESNKQLMKAYYLKNNISVIHNAYLNKPVARKQTRQELNIPSEAFVYILVARGIPEKGWLESVMAFAKTKSYNNSYLVLVGEGKGVDDARNYASQNRLKNILFTGYMKEPGEIIHLANAALLPTYFASESLPLSLVECLWAGLPLIATSIGGIPEIIKGENGDCGILVKMKSGKPDIDDLALAMDRMFNEADNFKKWIPYCRSNFDMRKTADEYLKIADRLTSNIVSGKNKVLKEAGSFNS
jgi:glycosyltransferase involved in cell wall biosynthesis